MSNKLACVFVIALLGASGASFAQEQEPVPPAFAAVALPSGLSPETADLVVHGRIGRDSPICLDLKTLMSFPSETFTSIDPWDKKTHSFTGVRLSGLLRRLGIEKEASSLLVKARNNYSTAIKRQDYERYGYILAWAIDGQPFGADPATKKRGPIAVAIDFASNKGLDADIYKHQLIWQVADILVQ
jgi:hypothetical protein